MFKKSVVALCGALMVSVPYTVPAAAQSNQSDNANEPPRVESSGSRARGSRSRQPRQAAAPTPEAIKAEAEAVLTAASLSCDVTDQRLLGTTGDNAKMFEVACATGPGYLLINSTPPLTIDCVIVDHTTKQEAAAGAEQAAPAGQSKPKCELPGNQDIQGVLRAYAVEAGVPCQADQVAVRGQASSGAIIYEVGCAGADGYWIEKSANGWTKTECLQVVSQQGNCSFTTPEEQAATVKSWLAGSEAADCNVGQVRLMGQNANGRFIELTCEGAEGRVIRHNAEFQVQQVYLCSLATQIGDGCQLPANKPDEA